MDELTLGPINATISLAHQHGRLAHGCCFTQTMMPTATIESTHEEAARYALLRRIAPTLRHHLAGEFQPLGMMAALLERRLQQRADPASLQEHCASLGQLSRQAAEHCMALMSWVSPKPDTNVAVGPAVKDCVQLLATSLRFRGFGLSSLCDELTAPVAGHALRSVLPAAILHLSDEAAGPADLHIEAQIHGAAVTLLISLQALDRAPEPASLADYRRMQWMDVCALAQAESVQVERAPEGLRLRLPTLA
jgi:hypothetical protein